MFKKIYSILFVFLCTASHLFAFRYDLTVCALFKDEAPFLREWVCFHMAQGVEHFYLYDNLSCDRWHLELEDLICAGIVEIIPWPHHSCDCKSFEEMRCKAFMHCIHRISTQARWCAFIDCNDFLFCPSCIPVNVFLKKFRKKHPCLCIARHVFGTSHIEKAPCGQLIRLLLWKCHPHLACCKVLRCIVQPKFVMGCEPPRRFILKDKQVCINPNKNTHSKHFFNDNIRINHYIHRDLDFFHNHWKKRHCCSEHECLDIDFNCIFDDCILRACPPL